MLSHLRIQNIAIIEEVTIDFEQGLNILTGETGAGKSILLDAVNAVLGHRVSKDLIRTGTDFAKVDALFRISLVHIKDLLTAYDIPFEDGQLLLHRTIYQNGKNICRINDRIITTSTLRLFGERLVAIHGQHDNQALLLPEKHIELLDLFSNEIEDLKTSYVDKFSALNATRKELERLGGDPSVRERKLDILAFQIEEIQNANLTLKEDENLREQRTLLQNQQKIQTCFHTLSACLYRNEDEIPTCYDQIHQGLRALSGILNLNPSFQELSSKLEDLQYRLEDLLETLSDHQNQSLPSQLTLEEVDERLDFISKLKRKYGSSIEDIIAYGKSIQKEQHELLHSEELVHHCNVKITKLQEELYELATALHVKRKEAADLFEDKISTVLHQLEIKNAIFRVDLQFENATELADLPFRTNGLSKVEFLISTNPGEPQKPLAKIASGGELSRIMLAIKTILAKIDATPTLIFDEVDTGISGIAGKKVAEKLSFVAKSHQVICITHLAPIAVMGNAHFFIQKIQTTNYTKTAVHRLDDDSRTKEIARLIGGDDSLAITLEHAKVLLSNASTSSSD